MTGAASAMSLVGRGYGIDTFTKTLLHFDGANGGTTFTDVTGLHTFTRTGTAGTISTSASKFGGSSYNPANANGLTSNTDYISSANSADWQLSNGDFTIEAWVQLNNNATDLNTNGVMIAQTRDGAANIGWIINHLNGNLRFNWTTDGSTTKTATFAWTVVASTWYHIAIARSGTTLFGFVNGSSIANTGTAISTDTLFNSTSIMSVAGNNFGSNATINGFMDEFRISKGVARWTASFTPQGVPYS